MSCEVCKIINQLPIIKRLLLKYSSKIRWRPITKTDWYANLFLVLELRERRLEDEIGPIVKFISIQILKRRDIAKIESLTDGSIYMDMKRKKNVVIKHSMYEAQCKPPVVNRRTEKSMIL